MAKSASEIRNAIRKSETENVKQNKKKSALFDNKRIFLVELEMGFENNAKVAKYTIKSDILQIRDRWRDRLREICL